MDRRLASGTVNASQSGNGPPLVLLHSLLSDRASFDKIVAMYVVSVVERPDKLLEELHRVCRPHGEIYLVNHVRSDNRFIAAVEKGLARFSDKLGFHPDFELRDMVGSAGELNELSRINFFWKVMRVKNGVAHPRLRA